MSVKFSRRELAGALAAAASAAQTADPQREQEDELASARRQAGENAKRLAAHQVPMSAEPAFVFRA